MGSMTSFAFWLLTGFGQWEAPEEDQNEGRKQVKVLIPLAFSLEGHSNLAASLFPWSWLLLGGALSLGSSEYSVPFVSLNIGW